MDQVKWRKWSRDNHSIWLLLRKAVGLKSAQEIRASLGTHSLSFGCSDAGSSVAMETPSVATLFPLRVHSCSSS